MLSCQRKDRRGRLNGWFWVAETPALEAVFLLLPPAAERLQEKMYVNRCMMEAHENMPDIFNLKVTATAIIL